MTSYFDHNAHITRRDKKESTTSWDVVDIVVSGTDLEWKYKEEGYFVIDGIIYPNERTYGGKKAGER